MRNKKEPPKTKALKKEIPSLADFERGNRLFSPLTLKKYQEELSLDVRIRNQIKVIRRELAKDSESGLRRLAVYDRNDHPLKHNKPFFRLRVHLREAIGKGKTVEAINTLDYLLSLYDGKPPVNGIDVIDPLDKYVDWRMLDDRDYGGKDSLYIWGMTDDVGPLGLRRDEPVIACWALTPEPGELIVFSSEHGNISLAQFLQWEWDEMLVTDPQGETTYIRPVTVLTVLGVERGGKYVSLLSQKTRSRGDAP